MPMRQIITTWIRNLFLCAVLCSQISAVLPLFILYLIHVWSMEELEGNVVLVCLQNRTREVRLPTDSMLQNVETLEEAVRATFSDVPTLTDSCQLILQVWSCTCTCTSIYTYISLLVPVCTRRCFNRLKFRRKPD